MRKLAKQRLLESIKKHNKTVNDASKFMFNEMESDLFVNMMLDFTRETTGKENVDIASTTVLENTVYKLTNGGYEIKNFMKTEVPIDRGILAPMIYEGLVKTYDHGEIKIHWDIYGRCSNSVRKDCFIDLSSK